MSVLWLSLPWKPLPYFLLESFHFLFIAQPLWRFLLRKRSVTNHSHFDANLDQHVTSPWGICTFRFSSQCVTASCLLLDEFKLYSPSRGISILLDKKLPPPLHPARCPWYSSRQLLGIRLTLLISCTSVSVLDVVKRCHHDLGSMEAKKGPVFVPVEIQRVLEGRRCRKLAGGSPSSLHIWELTSKNVPNDPRLLEFTQSEAEQVLGDR